MRLASELGNGRLALALDLSGKVELVSIGLVVRIDSSDFDEVGEEALLGTERVENRLRRGRNTQDVGGCDEDLHMSLSAYP